MAYFKELPNLEVVNTTSNTVSNDETLIVKNFFKRAKLREDIANVVTAFEFYNIEEDERPEQVAQKVYGDPELDWVILVTNNIINVQEDWPISKDSLDKHLIEKYGSEEELLNIRYYETIELRDTFNRVVLPGELLVDEAFYKAPEYETNSVPPTGITFPPTYIPGTQATANTVINLSGSVVAVPNLVSGLGYEKTPTVSISAPPITSNASANCLVSNYSISSIVNLVGGQGYNTTPSVSVGPPPNPIQSSAECELGEGIDSGKVVSIVNLVGGTGYAYSTPTIQFDSPSSLLNALFLNETFAPVGDQVDGMYVREDGYKLYTSNGIGTSLIREFGMTNPWDSNTISFSQDLNLSSDFSYGTGVDFKPDGTRMFVCGGKSGTFKIISYSLSVAWDIATASKINQVIVDAPGGIRFKSDGSRLYYLNANTTDKIEEYILTTPWDITTKGSINSIFNIENLSGDSGISGFSFFDDGKIIFATGILNTYVYQFNLSTAWDITTAVLVDNFFVGNKLSSPTDVFVRPNKKTLFVSGGSNDKLFEYDMYSVAEATAVLEGDEIVEIVITRNGFGYTEPPSITISAPIPSEAASLSASITAGVVTSISIINPGFGYTTPPSIGITSAPVSRQAQAICSLNDSTGIGTIKIINPGLNYQSAPTITFSAPSNILNVQIDEKYSQNNRIWKWNGTDWQEKITEEFQYFDPINNSLVKIEGNQLSKPVTNYEYELNLQESKRKIRILKPEYLSLMVSDLRDIMKYDGNSEGYINDQLRKTYNPKLTGV
jgi:hypothetical protein